jgi:hypothetical protein
LAAEGQVALRHKEAGDHRKRHREHAALEQHRLAMLVGKHLHALGRDRALRGERLKECAILFTEGPRGTEREAENADLTR